MVEVSLTALVKVTGGPSMPLEATLLPLSYSVASVDLPAAADPETPSSTTVPLLPDDGTVTLLSVRARTGSGTEATVTVTPTGGPEPDPVLTVNGMLLVSNADVLARIVTGGPRELTIGNAAAEPVVVDILALLDPAPEPPTP
ncbi:hypothetical protein QOZ88_02885 [Blastococcus sp. BMG 814]|uniref:Uncharacterized protein n=1 Tax=Blastococcus carthaginiensis TaxID=3050034 RepID=A0ABT9I8Y5_9ACTN|nr:hypothetical protein [Blastococcus carthaginiensis]MDP5181570.1 hypothetical protein [Blastococcus carthaginiensis]